MSVVYLGEDRVLKRAVAIKVMLPALAEDRNARLRFQREAEAVAGLRHPGILQVFDYAAPENEDPFIVMEYVDGLTLKRFLDRYGPIVPEAAARIVSDMARGLQAAHEAGIVHRDLKPENVMLARDGRILLMDFGIAHIMGVTKLTLTGALVGSPAHMAPEVIEGADIGPASDIFALGTVLYYTLTNGELPFQGRTPHEVMKRILEGDFPDVRHAEPLVGQELSAIIQNCMARNPADRYPTPATVADQIDRVIPPDLVPKSRLLVRNMYQAPEAMTEELRENLGVHLENELSEAQLHRDRARQLDIINRLLALDPKHEVAREGLELLSKHNSMLRWVRLVASAILLTLVVFVGFRHFSSSSNPSDSTENAANVVEPAPTIETDPAPIAKPPVVAAVIKTTNVRIADESNNDVILEPLKGPVSDPANPIKPTPPIITKSSDKGTKQTARIVRRRIPKRSIKKVPKRTTTVGTTAKPAIVKNVEEVPVTIRVQPLAAQIFVDGSPRGYGAAVGIKLKPGRHKLRIVHPHCIECAEINRTLTIPASEKAVEIKESLLGKFKPARLKVRVKGDIKEGSTVYFKGKPLGPPNRDLRIKMTDRNGATGQVIVMSAGQVVVGKQQVELRPGGRKTLDF
tara:strand:- start:381 stop:2273 length:1893 start_codon:yes stop_codon:yes gene_type:complete